MNDRAENSNGFQKASKVAGELLAKLAQREYIGARESDRRFSKLWFKGIIRARDGQKPWAYISVHPGLCSAAFDSLRSEGVDCKPHYDNPHITFVRREEVAELKKKFGDKWRGAVKEGQPIKFNLVRIVHLIPKGWDGVDRVWFLEVESPDLRKIRSGLGLTELPKSDDGKHDLRFHITFALRKSMAKAAAELVGDVGTPAQDEFPFRQTATKEGVRLQEVFDRMELDPSVTMRTLGAEYPRVTPEVLLRTSQKLLNINRGNESTDDRDSLAFQVVHGPEDFFAERISKDAGQAARKLLWRATLRNNLNHVPSGALTPQLRSVLLNSGMAMPLEEINPFDAYDQSQRVIRLGEGGIPSIDAVPDEARNVQNSHLGYIDPIRGPECYDDQTEVMTQTGWKRWPTVKAGEKLACLVEGRLEFHAPDHLVDMPYKGLMYGARTKFIEYLVTPNHRMWVKPQPGKERYVPLYRFESPEQVQRTKRLFCCGGHAGIPGDLAVFTLPLVEAEGKEKQVPGNPPVGASLKLVKEPIDIHDWAEFLGWYLSEGSLNGKYVTRISQSKAANPENCLAIERLLNRLPFSWCFVNGDTFTISSKQLHDYLERFGFCNDKFIPPEIFAAPPTARQLFVDAMLSGDGRKDGDGKARSLCTCSTRLARDFQLLAFQLGYSTRVSFEPDGRKETYLGCHVVCLHRVSERLTVQRSPRHPDGQYFTKEYDGRVYCATVPGGLLYVRRGNSVGFWCGNSEKIGVDSRVAHRTLRGSDGRFYAPMTSMRTGKEQLVSAEEASDSIIAFPGEMASKRPKVRAMVRSSKISYVDRDQVDYELPSPTQMLSSSLNLIPLISSIKGGRALMGGKYPAQALPLRNAEAPLVRSLSNDGRSFVGLLGEKMGAVRSNTAGVVEKVTQDEIVVKTPEGRRSFELMHNFPHNRKTYAHNTPLVKIGDPVKPGQLLASSNFTDPDGNMAIGKNLRAAYMPYRGRNYEDAIVISDSAAKRLSSEHMYQHPLAPEEGIEIGRKGFVSLYPAVFSSAQLKAIDERGVIKPGTRVKKGDPLILAVQRTLPTKLSRSHKPMFVNAAVTWDHDAEGVVTDADDTRDGGFNVAVKAYAPMEEGDKLAGFYGDKGVVSRIVPDSSMPHDSQGRPFEVLLNPLGVLARNNTAQVYEALLGKVADKTGTPVEIPGFMEGSLIDYVKKQLEDNRLSDTETVEDPETGRKIPGVLTGMRYMMKLHHTAESKGGGRDIGAYTAEGIPAKGGEYSSKRIGTMETNAIISHGACFMGSVNVETESGEIEISKIVSKRLPVKARCANVKTGQVEYRRVIDWLCRCVPPEELMIIETQARTACRIRGSHRAIRCTRGHEFYTPAGKVQAFYLKPGDTLLTPGTKVLPWQEEILLGGLMGDASMTRRSQGASGWAVCHGHAQWDYLNWKYGLLSNLGTKAPKRQKLSKGGFAKKPTGRFTLRSHHVTEELFSEFYGSGKKRPPIGIIKRMGWRGIGIWFGDDGSCVYSEKEKKITAFRFHTNDFTVEDVDRLARELQEFTGLPWRRYLQNGKYPILTLGNGNGKYERDVGNLKKFADMIQPYVPPMLAYKLRRKRCGSSWKGLKPPTGIWLEGTSVKSVKPYKPKPHERCLVYNITVEGHHNYIVHGVLVGNTEVLRDAKIIRGQRNDDFWRAFRLGYPPPSPKVPFVYDKFMASLNAAGVNTKKDGNRIHLFAMTDKDVSELTAGALKNADTVTGDDFRPVPGGLFDEGLTGGAGGNRWSHIPLAEPMPNPVMEEPIRRILGLTKNQYREVIGGQRDLWGATGGEAVRRALGKVNIDTAMEGYERILRDGPRSKRDDAAKVLGYLRTVKDNGISMQDWVMTKWPVLPPSMRPITVMKEMQLVADPNYLYRDLFFANQDLEEIKGVVGTKRAANERLKVYDGMRAVSGLGDPIQAKTKEKNVKGLLQHVFGGTPKAGMYQRRVLNSAVDVVGRATITPNPELGIDQVGLPEPKAWTIYRPFVVRNLVRRGLPSTQAAVEVANQTRVARDALLDEIGKRPVIINRAPTLHRYGFMAAWPVLTKGETLQVPPPIVTGFNADFDGDAMNYHVPVSDEAVKDAVEKMMPSRNLKSVRDFKVHYLPRHEFTMGLYLASRPSKERKSRVFRSKQDVIAAYQRGDIGLGEKVVIGGS